VVAAVLAVLAGLAVLAVRSRNAQQHGRISFRHAARGDDAPS
jgi:hypothetical protein